MRTIAAIFVLAEILKETLYFMKSILVIALISTILLFTSCKKSNNNTNARPALTNLLGSWTFKSSRCYQDPNIIISLLPNTIFTFRSDMTASYNSPGAVGIPFSYNLLADDSTLILYRTVPDTFVITSLTSTELVYHGKNTYAHNPSSCVNGNTLDSLYR